jgi:hypothetical protein
LCRSKLEHQPRIVAIDRGYIDYKVFTRWTREGVGGVELGGFVALEFVHLPQYVGVE